MADRPGVVIPNPDPSVITSEAIDRRVNNMQAVLEARIEGMDRAIIVFQDNLTRVPTQLDRAVAGLRDLLEARLLSIEKTLDTHACNFKNQPGYLEAATKVVHDLLGEEIAGVVSKFETRLNAMDKARDVFLETYNQTPAFVRDQVEHLQALHDTRFEGVQTQFTLLKQATEQLDLANKTAIAAALQAQKESAGETQKSSQAAIAKSENSTSEAIKALTTTFNAAITGATDRINDLKGRMDRGEGKSSVADPDTTAKLNALMAQVASLGTARDQHTGSERTSDASSAKLISFVAIAVTLAIGVGEIITRLSVHP
jgi:hypothetical protein